MPADEVMSALPDCSTVTRDVASLSDTLYCSVSNVLSDRWSLHSLSNILFVCLYVCPSNTQSSLTVEHDPEGVLCPWSETINMEHQVRGLIETLSI